MILRKATRIEVGMTITIMGERWLVNAITTQGDRCALSLSMMRYREMSAMGLTAARAEREEATLGVFADDLIEVDP